MKPITEQERQSLIDHGNELKGRIEQYGYGREFESKTLQLVEIALTSLTAEPFVYVNAVTVRNGVVASLVANGVGLYDGNLPVELYSAPPVPVIKFPSEIDNWLNSATKAMGAIGFCGNSQSFTVGANWMLSEVKRLNGIK